MTRRCYTVTVVAKMKVTKRMTFVADSDEFAIEQAHTNAHYELLHKKDLKDWEDVDDSFEVIEADIAENDADRD